MRNRRTFTVEFKAQMVKLYENGKPRKDIIREYDLTPSALDKWIKQKKHPVHLRKRTIVLQKKMN